MSGFALSVDQQTPHESPEEVGMVMDWTQRKLDAGASLLDPAVYNFPNAGDDESVLVEPEVPMDWDLYYDFQNATYRMWLYELWTHDVPFDPDLLARAQRHIRQLRGDDRRLFEEEMDRYERVCNRQGYEDQWFDANLEESEQYYEYDAAESVELAAIVCEHGRREISEMWRQIRKTGKRGDRAGTHRDHRDRRRQLRSERVLGNLESRLDYIDSPEVYAADLAEDGDVEQDDVDVDDYDFPEVDDPFVKYADELYPPHLEEESLYAAEEDGWYDDGFDTDYGFGDIDPDHERTITMLEEREGRRAQRRHALKRYRDRGDRAGYHPDQRPRPDQIFY